MRLFPFRSKKEQGRAAAGRGRAPSQRPGAPAGGRATIHGGEGWLSAHDVKKSLPQPAGGEGRLPGHQPGRGGWPAGPQRRRQDDRVLHGHRPGRRPTPAASRSTGATSRACPCTAAPGWASATCRKRQSIFRGLTVEQNIMAVLELVEPNRKRRKEQLDALLEEFEITHKRKAPVPRPVRRRAPPLRDRAGTWPPDPRSCCSTNPLRASTRWRSGHPELVRHLTAPGHRRGHHRPQRSGDAEPRRPGLHHLRRPGLNSW